MTAKQAVTYLWTERRGGELFYPSGTVVRVDGIPLPGIYQRIWYETGRRTKLVSGAEVPLTATECHLLDSFLSEYQ